MGRVVAIIQARMGSSRLPGKSMMDLAGKPLVHRVLERITQAKLLDEVVLAIPDTFENRVLAEVGEECGVKVFSGSEGNLLDRYYKAALESDAEFIVRIPADNATPYSVEIDKIVEHHLGLERAGFTSNLAQIFNSGYPDGIGAEVFDFSLLEESWIRETHPDKLEHIHLNFFNYSSQQGVDEKWCPISTIKCPPEYARPDVVLDVNTQVQYEYMSKLYADLYPKNPNFGILEIIEWHDEQLAKLALERSQVD
jgi:spore coat polysaccharide biosynthesis protein SpsF (cytidylyltransferase family)